MSLPVDLECCSCLAFSGDGATFAAAHSHEAREVILWDLNSWQVRKKLAGVTGYVTTIAFSPDGKFLVAGAGKTLWVWEVGSGDVVVRHSHGTRSYMGIAFSPGGRLLAFARTDGSVTFWNTGTWTEAAAYDFKIGPMTCLAFAPDGMRCAGGSGKGKIVVFDIDL